MRKRRIYISLPIAHYDLEERKAYADKVEKLLSEFYEVVNPFNNGVPDEADWRVHMKKDLQMLLECDAIFMCKGFEKSKGCKIEWDVATTCGMEVFYEDVKTATSNITLI
jgi:hypothetical protein